MPDSLPLPLGVGKRVLVTGGRSYGSFGKTSPGSPDYARAFAERGIMCRALDDAKAAGMTVLIHGGSTGADAYCARWAKGHRVEAIVFRANWEWDGKRAGPLRNQRMIDEGRPDLVIGFEGGAGTADMIRRARAAGIEVKEVG